MSMDDERQSCANCLWHWLEVHGGDGYRCYNTSGPCYHEEPHTVCDKYESKVYFNGLYSTTKKEGKQKYD